MRDARRTLRCSRQKATASAPPGDSEFGPLGLGGPGGRDAFGDLFQIAVTAAWAKERDGEPIRNPRARSCAR
jgi:hypothetical protein